MKLVAGVSLGVVVEPGDTDERSRKAAEAPRVNDFGGVFDHMKEIGERFRVIAPFTLDQGEAEAGLEVPITKLNNPCEHTLGVGAQTVLLVVNGQF